MNFSYCRWLKASGVCIGNEEKMRQIAKGIIRDNLKAEVAPFSFPLASGGEELRGAVLVYIPNLVDKVIQLLDDNDRYIEICTLNEFTHLHILYPVVHVGLVG